MNSPLPRWRTFSPYFLWKSPCLGFMVIYNNMDLPGHQLSSCLGMLVTARLCKMLTNVDICSHTTWRPGLALSFMNDGQEKVLAHPILALRNFRGQTFWVSDSLHCLQVALVQVREGCLESVCTRVTAGQWLSGHDGLHADKTDLLVDMRDHV